MSDVAELKHLVKSLQLASSEKVRAYRRTDPHNFARQVHKRVHARMHKADASRQVFAVDYLELVCERSRCASRTFA